MADSTVRYRNSSASFRTKRNPWLRELRASVNCGAEDYYLLPLRGFDFPFVISTNARYGPPKTAKLPYASAAHLSSLTIPFRLAARG